MGAVEVLQSGCQNAGMASDEQTNSAAAESAKPNDAAHGRSWVLEAIGVFSAVAFFVGVLFAFRTQSAGVITEEEFNQVRVRQTLAEVEAALGTSGEIVTKDDAKVVENSSENDSASPKQNADRQTYIWENSRASYVKCVFENGRVIEKQARNLP